MAKRIKKQKQTIQEIVKNFNEFNRGLRKQLEIFLREARAEFESTEEIFDKGTEEGKKDKTRKKLELGCYMEYDKDYSQKHNNQGGNMTLIYYYIYSMHEQRIAGTVCILILNRKIARGIAICSSTDKPIKAEGRSIAWQRARFAMLENITTCKMRRNTPEMQVVKRELRCKNKAVFNPRLTPYEVGLLLKKAYKET